MSINGRQEGITIPEKAVHARALLPETTYLTLRKTLPCIKQKYF